MAAATARVKLTSGLVGLYMATCLDALIFFGKEHYGSTAVASSIGLTAFGLMLVVAAYESRSLTGTTLVHEAFDNPRMNWTAVVEIALAVMVTQMDLFNRLLDTFTSIGGKSRHWLAALDAATGAATAWYPRLVPLCCSKVFAFAEGPDGSLWAGGDFSGVNRVPQSNIARFEP